MPRLPQTRGESLVSSCKIFRTSLVGGPAAVGFSSVAAAGASFWRFRSSPSAAETDCQIQSHRENRDLALFFLAGGLCPPRQNRSKTSELAKANLSRIAGELVFALWRPGARRLLGFTAQQLRAVEGRTLSDKRLANRSSRFLFGGFIVGLQRPEGRRLSGFKTWQSWARVFFGPPTPPAETRFLLKARFRTLARLSGCKAPASESEGLPQQSSRFSVGLFRGCPDRGFKAWQSQTRFSDPPLWFADFRVSRVVACQEKQENSDFPLQQSKKSDLPLRIADFQVSRVLACQRNNEKIVTSRSKKALPL